MKIKEEITIEKIAKKATKRTFDKGHKATEELDTDEANRLLGRAAVAGWDGFPTYHGQPLEYSPEACDRLINKWGEFSRFVNDACTDYARLVDEQSSGGTVAQQHRRTSLDKASGDREPRRDLAGQT